ncbi:IS607 family transposase [Leptotrichia sp. oral taxon 221]|jgi:inosine-5'-monophosphate dehydrogenase|uniref:IS607 family transposase n=1 Tax=Leptotrichia sp. oral taxon 221 TaxID=712362 RepID=UPI001B8BBE53|nr:IS607 family transposase [Leptotrichia sp. oral taxon 221]QUB97082.1 IS607 family transposase [Leptotrichia sp. oral taxon 221]
MNKIYKPNEFGKMIGRTVNTLQRWDREGILKARRTPTNRRYYTEEDYYNIMGIQQENAENQVNDVIIYARVSNQNQKDDLKNQVEFLKTYANAKGYIISSIITDIGSGLDYNRKGFNSILYSEKKQKILISYKDRFVRFGYSWFDNFLKSKGSEIIVVNNQTLSPKQELVEDLISIIQIFSYRIDGLKKYKKKIKNDEEL